ncbi:MAG: hypothetical protein AB7O98_05025 [Hyphomonadaceae bacterium]
MTNVPPDKMASMGPTLRHSHFIICVGAAGFHAVYTLQASWLAPSNALALLSGAVATGAALCGALWLTLNTDRVARHWAKAALTFALLGPFLWWTVLWPAATDLLCIGALYCNGQAFHVRRLADVEQAQFAIALTGISTFVCTALAASMQYKAEGAGGHN